MSNIISTKILRGLIRNRIDEIKLIYKYITEINTFIVYIIIDDIYKFKIVITTHKFLSFYKNNIIFVSHREILESTRISFTDLIINILRNGIFKGARRNSENIYYNLNLITQNLNSSHGPDMAHILKQKI